MHSLLIGINLRRQMSTLWPHWSTVIGQTMPTLDVASEAHYHPLPELNGGWLTFEPTTERHPALISSHEYEEAIVIAIGHLYQAHATTLAEQIAHVWHDEGIDAVRLLDGCFAAVVIDRMTKSLYMVNDLTGRRAFRYFVDGTTLFISTHDLPLVATGRCPVELDLVSACSTVLFDWSVGGRSFLRAVESVPSGSYVMWQAGEVDVVHKHLLDPAYRIAAGDRYAIQQQTEAVIDHIRMVTRIFCEGADRIEADLTAGMDSRTVLAMLLSTGYPTAQIGTTTTGDLNSADVRAARYIARRYKVEHVNLSPPAPDSHAFLRHLDLLAYYVNGDTNGKRAAVNPLPSNNVQEAAHLYGGGGEIYSGYYYPSEKEQLSATWELPAVEAYLFEKISGGRCTVPLAAELTTSVSARMRQIITGYRVQSANLTDILDLFYLYDRFGHWGGLAVRGSWWSHYFSPFGSPTAIRLAFELPAPIGATPWLHHAFLQRYLQKAYRWPLINEETFLPLLPYPTLQQRFAKPVQQIYHKVYRKAAKLNPLLRGKTRDLYQVQADAFTTSLRDVVTDTLLDPDGVTLPLLGPDVAKEMVQSHMSGRQNHAEVMGALLTLERWYTQIKQVAAASQPNRDIEPMRETRLSN